MKQEEFASRIRKALDEGADQIDYKTQLRLEHARKTALAKHRSQPLAAPIPASVAARTLVAAGGPGLSEDPGVWTWLRGAGLLAPLFVLIVGFVGIYQWQKARAISDLANIDFAVLMDELPLDTYADKGFTAVLNGQSIED